MTPRDLTLRSARMQRAAPAQLSKSRVVNGKLRFQNVQMHALFTPKKFLLQTLSHFFFFIQAAQLPLVRGGIYALFFFAKRKGANLLGLGVLELKLAAKHETNGPKVTSFILMHLISFRMRQGRGFKAPECSKVPSASPPASSLTKSERWNRGRATA